MAEAVGLPHIIALGLRDLLLLGLIADIELEGLALPTGLLPAACTVYPRRALAGTLRLLHQKLIAARRGSLDAAGAHKRF